MQREWADAKERVDTLHNRAKRQQEKRGDLISYLEGLYVDRHVVVYKLVSADFAKLCQAQDDTLAKTNSLDKAITEKNAVVALEIVLSAADIMNSMDSLEYLSDISDDFIYGNFATIWREHSFISGANRLSVDDRLTLIDMRVRSMNGVQPQDEKPVLQPAEVSVRQLFE